MQPVALCDKVWHHADAPRAWHEALISMTFKKGYAGNGEKYRPI